MGTFKISFNISPAPGITNDLIAVLYKTTAPTAEIDRIVKPDPHPTPYNFQFNDLDAGNYIVKIHESPDGSTLGNLRHDFWVNSVTNQIIFERRFYLVGGAGAQDPVDGSTTIVDPYFDGKSIYGVFKEGFRYLRPTTEFTQVTDTITLLAGSPLSDGEIIIVEINFAITETGSSGKAFPAGIIEVSTDITISSTHYGQLMEANGAGTILTISFPALATIPDETLFAFNTHKGNQRYLAISFISGGYCQVDGANRTTIWMGKGEELSVIKKGTYLRVISWPGDRKRVGELVKADKPPLNSIAETGGWYLFTDYPRIYNEYVNTLDPSLLGTGTYPSIPTGDNVRKWCIDVVNARFWVPDTGGYFDRNTDPDGNIDLDRLAGDRKAGTSQGDTVGPHSHPGINSIPTGSHASASSALSGAIRFLVNTFASGGSTATANLTVADNSGTTETHPKNINRNAYRII